MHAKHYLAIVGGYLALGIGYSIFNSYMLGSPSMSGYGFLGFTGEESEGAQIAEEVFAWPAALIWAIAHHDVPSNATGS